MVQAIILAGGRSQRVGHNKLTLAFRGRPLFLHAVATVEPFADAVVVVSGKYHDDIVRSLPSSPKVRVVPNPRYEAGMFASIRCGVAATEGDMLVLPGDTPLVRGTTVARLLAADGDIRVPTYQGRTGHPIFLSGTLRRALLDLGDGGNLREFRDRVGYTKVAVDDPGILIDIDTLNDYERLLEPERKENP